MAYTIRITIFYCRLLSYKKKLRFNYANVILLEVLWAREIWSIGG